MNVSKIDFLQGFHKLARLIPINYQTAGAKK